MMINFPFKNWPEDARDVVRPASAQHDETAEYPWEVIKQAHEIGLLNTHIPESAGGLELGCLDGIFIGEELAWGCTGISTAIEANGLAQQPVILGGTDAQHQKYLAPMVEEPTMCAYAVTEPGAGSDVQGMKTTAVKKATNTSSTAPKCGSPTPVSPIGILWSP